MKLLALTIFSLRELIARTTLIILAGISTLIIVGTALSLSSTTTADGVTLMIFGNPVSAALAPDTVLKFVQQMQASLASGLFGGILLFGVIATASLIPDALEKGTVDIYLSKPVARWELLLGRSFGAITAIFLNVLYFIGAIYLIVGIKLGVWNHLFLLSSVALPFTFGCLFSLMVFLGVVSRNAIVSILGTYFFLLVIAGMLQNREMGLYLLSENSVYRSVVDGLYYSFPQIGAMQQEAAKIILGQLPDWKPFVQSFLSSTVIFLASDLILKKRDF
jgi:ABC-type transport system involved in multi-copper enzyme maturation permease subunit